MSISVAAITFGLIMVAELPDKTMIATIVMASRNRPIPVFAGASSAMVLNSGVAVGAGRLIELLPHRAVEGVVAAVFLAGSLYLLLVREKAEEREGMAEADAARPGRRVVLATFAVIVVAEFGDISQLLTANLVARYHAPLSVFVGSALALVVVMGVGVVGGRALLRVTPLSAIRRVAGLILLGLAVYSAVSVA
jgi:putative Ca2+/H+ antiporter (TMEM165/GDT1 family)